MCGAVTRSADSAISRANGANGINRRMVSVQSRRWQLYFTAAVFTGILGCFLVFDFIIDHLAKIRPLRRWSDQLPAIYEQCRGPSHGQLFGLTNGSVHFRLGRFGVDAALQLQSIKLFPLGELH